MKKFAANRLYLSASEYIAGPVVVCLDEHGLFAGYELLGAEQPYVSWLGGIFILLPVSVPSSQIHASESIDYLVLNAGYAPQQTEYTLWQVCDIPVDADITIIPTKAIRHIG